MSPETICLALLFVQKSLLQQSLAFCLRQQFARVKRAKICPRCGIIKNLASEDPQDCTWAKTVDGVMQSVGLQAAHVLVPTGRHHHKTCAAYWKCVAASQTRLLTERHLRRIASSCLAREQDDDGSCRAGAHLLKSPRDAPGERPGQGHLRHHRGKQGARNCW